MALVTESYVEQAAAWPQSGRCVLAQFDDETIVGYQAYAAPIGHYAAEHGRFGGAFSYNRMSWIKPNFLWMMYRCGWGTKPDQEVVLAIRLQRSLFDALLAKAVPSSWDPALFPTQQKWSHGVRNYYVRLYWSPDQDRSGTALRRRAIQLGLRGHKLEAFGMREPMEVLDVSDFVREQRALLARQGVSALLTPRERVYRPGDPALAARLGLTG